MKSEQAAFQAAQKKHYHHMQVGKKQRYIEVIQCSGEDMNYQLTGNVPSVTNGVLPPPAASSGPISVASSTAASPVKNTIFNQAAIAAAAASNPLMAAASAGLLPPGMFAQPHPTLTGLGIDPNAMAAAASLQPNPLAAASSPFAIPQAAMLYHPGAAAAAAAPGFGGSFVPTRPQTMTPTTNAADMNGLLGLAAAQQQFMISPNAAVLRPQGAASLHQQNGLLAYNQAVQQQLQLQQQQQLLQSQLAAQRMLLPGAASAAASASNPKRSFDQAFNAPNANVSSANEDPSAKRATYGLSAPTISAGPTTYSR